MFRRITVFILCLLLCAAPVMAAHTEDIAPGPLPDPTAEIAADPVQQDIADQWAALVPEATSVFSVVPSAVAPYSIGALDGTCLNDALRLLNFYRRMAGLEEVTLSDHLNVQAQYGAVLLAANNDLTHTPQKPSGMGESFYRMGANACAGSNISMRYGYDINTLLHSALQAHMDELSASNRLNLGHRRWLLDPALGKVGFGLATSSTNRQYITVPISDDTGTGTMPEAVLWPAAGHFPNNIFAPGTPWSVILDPEVYRVPRETQLQVTVTRHRDGKTFVPPVLDGQAQLTDEGSYLLVNSENYGAGCCVSFSIGKTALGDSSYWGDYTVRVTGLYTLDGQHAPLEYTVRFFDAEALSQPSAWAMDEVLAAAQLTLIPEDLTDFYQAPITRMEFCRLAMQSIRQKTGLTNEELVEQYRLPGVLTTFSDCTDPDVLAAAAIGVVFGPGDGTFRPGDLITRQDAAVLLMQAAAALDLPIDAGDGLLYRDADRISSYAQPAVSWVSRVRDSVSGNAVMGGLGDGRFDPMSSYTREQAILTLLRMFRWDHA
ncbi:MAG: S-layer homology domain-containing protein [Clostridia bacterium]|nr:S-layer homology domain-containing protein [Clostridia bacterium]